MKHISWRSIVVMISVTFCIISIFLLHQHITTEESRDTIDVDLGQYLNLLVEQKDIIVTKKDIQNELEYRLMGYVKYKDVENVKIKNGDVVTVSLSNPLDKSQLSYVMRIGENEISSQIDEVVLDMYKDETKNVEVGNISYILKVERIQHVIYPELSEQFVKEHLRCDSLSKYKKQLKEEIYQIKLELELEGVKNNLLNMVVEDSKIYGCTQERIIERFDELKKSYESYAKLYNLSYDEVLSQYETDEKQMKQHVIQNIKQEIVVDAIMKKEHMDINKTKYQNLEMNYIAEYGYDSIEKFIEDCGQEYLESEVNKNIVKEFLYKNAIIRSE